MISLYTVILIIVIHFFADFVCQTHEMAINKSKDNYWLSAHVRVYTLVSFLVWDFCILQPSIEYHLNDYLVFLIFVFGTHWITDYITSRFSGKYFGSGDYHNGFVVVGLNQVLHYIQLFFIYNYITHNH